MTEAPAAPDPALWARVVAATPEDAAAGASAEAITEARRFLYLAMGTKLRLLPPPPLAPMVAAWRSAVGATALGIAPFKTPAKPLRNPGYIRARALYMQTFGSAPPPAHWPPAKSPPLELPALAMIVVGVGLAIFGMFPFVLLAFAGLATGMLFCGWRGVGNGAGQQSSDAYASGGD